MAKDKQDSLELAGAEAPKDSPGEQYKALAIQCEAEFDIAWKHQKPKKDEAEVRLKLLNNQMRDKDAFGDTTLFTIHQTVIASLYMDRLSVEFGGKEEGDEETADNLTAMAESDYVDMKKDELDYYWLWDMGFFGRGLISMNEFVRDPDNGIYLPIPENIDPIPFLRHPGATSVHGNALGKGGARYFGWEVTLTEEDIEQLPGRLESFKMSELSTGSGSKSLLEDATQARDAAQGRQYEKTEGGSDKKLGANTEYAVTVWNTHYKMDDEVKKVKVWLSNERKTVIGFQVLKSESKNIIWPVLDRPLYPTSHDWDGTSIPDLVEDKQRAKALGQNLGFKAVKSDLYPTYVYDSNKGIDRNDLKLGFDKYIPVDLSRGDGNLGNSILPLNKSRPNLGLLNFILESIDISAQKATATPDIQQGIQSEKDRPLGETNLIQGNVNTRYSLSAKVIGWSEQAFWLLWYRSYKDNFADDIDEKVLRIQGSLGPKWRPLVRSNFISRLDPDITINSTVLTKAKELEQRTNLSQFFALAFQDPTSNRRWGLRKLGKLNGLEKDELDRLFPPTIDERIAEDENELLSQDKKVDVQPEDDHNVHIEINSKASDTDAKTVHLETHKEALSIKKVNPEFFPEDPEAATFQPPGTNTLELPGASTGGSARPPVTGRAT